MDLKNQLIHQLDVGLPDGFVYMTTIQSKFDGRVYLFTQQIRFTMSMSYPPSESPVVSEFILVTSMNSKEDTDNPFADKNMILIIVGIFIGIIVFVILAYCVWCGHKSIVKLKNMKLTSWRQNVAFVLFILIQSLNSVVDTNFAVHA